MEWRYDIEDSESCARVTIGNVVKLGDLELDLYYKNDISSAYHTVLFHHILGTVWAF